MQTVYPEARWCFRCHFAHLRGPAFDLTRLRDSWSLADVLIPGCNHLGVQYNARPSYLFFEGADSIANLRDQSKR